MHIIKLEKKMSGAAYFMKYSRVKSNVLAPVSRDPVLQHMSAWHLRHHDLRVRSAQPWEHAHVNPGRRRRTPDRSNHSPAALQPHLTTFTFGNNDVLSKRLNHNSSGRLGLKNSNETGPQIQKGRICLTVSKTSPVQKSMEPLGQPVRWQAHAASHARQTSGQDSHAPFCPRILETGTISRLRQSCHYQQPRSRRTASRPSPSSAAGSGGSEEVGKVWQVPSPCSVSSSSGDSAYEAGGSSPPSRGSTPRPQNHASLNHGPPSRASSQGKLNSGPGSSTSDPSQPRPSKSPTADESEDSPLASLQCEPTVPTSSRQCKSTCSLGEEPDFPFSTHTIKPLPRSEGLEYAMFEHDLVSEIVSAGLLTNVAVKQACRTHMAAYCGRLPQDKMEEVITRLQELLDVPSDDGMDSVCFGLGGAHHRLAPALPQEYGSTSSSLDRVNGIRIDGDGGQGLVTTQQPLELQVVDVESTVTDNSELEDGYSSPSFLLNVNSNISLEGSPS